MACSNCSCLRLLVGEVAFCASATTTDWVESTVEVTTWVTGSTISVVIALPPRVSSIWLVANVVTVSVTVSVCVSSDVCK